MKFTFLSYLFWLALTRIDDYQSSSKERMHCLLSCHNCSLSSFSASFSLFFPPSLPSYLSSFPSPFTVVRVPDILEVLGSQRTIGYRPIVLSHGVCVPIRVSLVTSPWLVKIMSFSLFCSTSLEAFTFINLSVHSEVHFKMPVALGSLSSLSKHSSSVSFPVGTCICHNLALV